MAPPVVQYVADSEGDNATPEGLVGSMQQQGDAGAASESVALKDGRRRSSRLRGKGALESPPVVVKKGATESSSRRGRRKKGVTVESVQDAVVKVESVQDAVVKVESEQDAVVKVESVQDAVVKVERVQDVKVEAPAAAAVAPQGLLPEETVEGDESGANPAAAVGDAGALASISVSPHVDEKETVKTEDAVGGDGALVRDSVSQQDDIEELAVKSEDAGGDDGALVRDSVSQQDDVEKLAAKTDESSGDGCASVSPSPHVDERLTEDHLGDGALARCALASMSRHVDEDLTEKTEDDTGDGALVRCTSASISRDVDEGLNEKTEDDSGDGALVRCALASVSRDIDEELTEKIEDDSGDGALVRCTSASVSRDVDEELTEKIEDDSGDGALVHCASASVSRDVDEELTVKTIELGDGALVHCASASVSRDVDEVLTVETEDGMGDGALARCASAHVDEGLTVKTEELGGGALVRCAPASISRDVDEGLTVETEDDMGDGALARCASAHFDEGLTVKTEDDMGDGALARCASAHFDEGLTVKTEELGDEALVTCGSPHANGDEKLDELFLVDDEDGEGKALLMDAKGDFCDSNIFGDLQSIVNLHPVENGILRMEVPSSSKGEDKVEAKERANVGPAPADEVTTVITVQASCETITKDVVSETEPVVSDPQEEEGASRGSTSKAEDCEDSQGLASGSEGKKKEYSIVFQARATLKITSETSCLRSDGEGIVQLGKKSDSLKSVNQEIRVSDGDVAGTMKVESRSHSRHTGNTAGGEDDSSGVTEGDDNTNAEKVDESVSINSKAGWVKCDACNKWRSIPVELAEKIGGTNAYWSCKENPNKSFADCSIPQVKSNEEINKDLGISESSSCDEEDDAEATCDSKPTYSGRPTVTLNGQAIWKQIKRNIFKHRKQKHQDADEAMVCQCGPPKVGEAACGDDCLNRMLNVECLPQMCPCGSLCTNMQFQKREYAKVELFRCGKKGHGLQAKERISRGSFVIEYVGEVLDMPSFEGRQKEYSMNSQKHFYFMTLSANEVIDACSKGNLGRFINHSCDPNCQTEKWMVDGEVCIGLFAIRDVAKGEEITFDYNFVRVGGADAKKCECGARKCRGFIGVDPDTPQNVLEIDSDDGEDPEPIMLQADSDEEPDEYLDKSKSVAKKARLMSGSESVYENLKSGVKRKFYSGGAKDVKYSKRSRRVKTAASSKIITHKPAPPRLFSGSRFGVRNTYYSDVESKLGELTDETGGLRKQRDVGRQYLKLLVLTAASGGNVNGAAACSARDLSMLLEALLKTQKSSSLRDIMNKNGLQMFHNLIKQVRKSFEKRPILRKLLKVLDHLAKKRVLTVELIYSAPRSGSECFTDTLFDLSRHDDTEVQNMARNFRKLYVPPRPPKPMANPERPLVKSPSQQSSVAVASPSVAGSPQVASSVSNKPEQAPGVQEETVEGDSANAPTTSRRKRPSRWDTVAETGTPASSSGMAVSAPSAGVPSEPVTSNAPLPPASSVPAARPSVPARPSGSLPPVRPHQVYQQQLYPPGLQPPFPPGMQPQVYPPGPMLPGQRPDIAMAPMHFMPGASSQMHPFAVGRGHSNQVHGATPHGAPPHVPYPMMHSMYAGAPFAAPPPPLPPSGRPSWGQHSGGFSGRALEAEASEASRGQGKRSSKEPGESDEAREPSVPGMSPAKPHKERSSSGVSGAPARPSVEVGGARAESSPKAHRGEHGSRTHGHESRSRSVADSGEPTQHGYSRPDHREGRSEKEMSWDTPECSSFHHHVSGMIRARVEKKRMVHYKDLEKFCSKLTEVVTRKEIKKYRENKKEGMQKVILRSKLLEKVDAYVDLQMEVYRKLKKGDGQS